MERTFSRPRFIPASKLPLVEVEAGFLFPINLKPTVESLGFHPRPSPEDGHLMIELSSKISLEVFQALLRSPETKELPPEDEDSDSDDAMEESDDETPPIEDSQVIDLDAIEKPPRKRKRKE